MPDGTDLEPLFRTILETIPAPTYVEGAPLQAHVTNLDASPFLGRLALLRDPRRAPCARARTSRGCGATARSRTSGSPSSSSPRASSASPASRPAPGDIVAVAGIPEITIGETLADPEQPGRRCR